MEKERKRNFITNWLFVSTQLNIVAPPFMGGRLDDGSATVGAMGPSRLRRDLSSR
jgi:hypothetical protein